MNRGKGRCHKEKEGKRRRNRRELEGGVRASRRAQREDACRWEYEHKRVMSWQGRGTRDLAFQI
jgi:hypothetical protein